VKLVFDPLADANLDQAQQDPPLYDAFVEALEAIEDGLPRARETPLRRPGGTAWALRVLVPGRDDEYQVIWAQFPDGRINVVHLGRVL
jgi:hypothetical protein